MRHSFRSMVGLRKPTSPLVRTANLQADTRTWDLLTYSMSAYNYLQVQFKRLSHNLSWCERLLLGIIPGRNLVFHFKGNFINMVQVSKH
jgi:hypothetical protein